MMKPETQKWMDDLDSFCRERLGMPDSWAVHTIAHLPQDGSSPTHYKLTGNHLTVPGDMFTRRWSKNRHTKHTVIAAFAEFEAWVAAKDAKAKTVEAVA